MTFWECFIRLLPFAVGFFILFGVVYPVAMVIYYKCKFYAESKREEILRQAQNDKTRKNPDFCERGDVADKAKLFANSKNEPQGTHRRGSGLSVREILKII